MVLQKIIIVCAWSLRASQTYTLISPTCTIKNKYSRILVKNCIYIAQVRWDVFLNISLFLLGPVRLETCTEVLISRSYTLSYTLLDASKLVDREREWDILYTIIMYSGYYATLFVHRYGFNIVS